MESSSSASSTSKSSSARTSCEVNSQGLKEEKHSLPSSQPHGYSSGVISGLPHGAGTGGSGTIPGWREPVVGNVSSGSYLGDSKAPDAQIHQVNYTYNNVSQNNHGAAIPQAGIKQNVPVKTTQATSNPNNMSPTDAEGNNFVVPNPLGSVPNPLSMIGSPPQASAVSMQSVNEAKNYNSGTNNIQINSGQRSQQLNTSKMQYTQSPQSQVLNIPQHQQQNVSNTLQSNQNRSNNVNSSAVHRYAPQSIQGVQPQKERQMEHFDHVNSPTAKPSLLQNPTPYAQHQFHNHEPNMQNNHQQQNFATSQNQSVRNGSVTPNPLSMSTQVAPQNSTISSASLQHQSGFNNPNVNSMPNYQMQQNPMSPNQRTFVNGTNALPSATNAMYTNNTSTVNNTVHNSKAISSNNSMDSQIKQKIVLTQNVRTVLTAAVVSSLKSTDGSIDPKAMENAVAAGLPRSAVLNAAKAAAVRHKQKMANKNKQIGSGVSTSTAVGVPNGFGNVNTNHVGRTMTGSRHEQPNVRNASSNGQVHAQQQYPIQSISQTQHQRRLQPSEQSMLPPASGTPVVPNPMMGGTGSNHAAYINKMIQSQKQHPKTLNNALNHKMMPQGGTPQQQVTLPVGRKPIAASSQTGNSHDKQGSPSNVENRYSVFQAGANYPNAINTSNIKAIRISNMAKNIPPKNQMESNLSTIPRAQVPNPLAGTSISNPLQKTPISSNNFNTMKYNMPQPTSTKHTPYVKPTKIGTNGAPRNAVPKPRKPNAIVSNSLNRASHMPSVPRVNNRKQQPYVPIPKTPNIPARKINPYPAKPTRPVVPFILKHERTGMFADWKRVYSGLLVQDKNSGKVSVTPGSMGAFVKSHNLAPAMDCRKQANNTISNDKSNWLKEASRIKSLLLKKNISKLKDAKTDDKGETLYENKDILDSFVSF